ncbi:MAG: hypothetical protein ACFUZC_22695 [Chthoniobacteraceae bacterium]
MNPILDQILVGAVIAVALLYFIFRKKKCGAGCECTQARLKRNVK